MRARTFLGLFLLRWISSALIILSRFKDCSFYVSTASFQLCMSYDLVKEMYDVDWDFN